MRLRQNSLSASRKQAVPLDHKAMPESEHFNSIDSLLIFERDDERVRALIDLSHLEVKVRILSQCRRPVATKRILAIHDAILGKANLLGYRRCEDDIVVEVF